MFLSKYYIIYKKGHRFARSFIYKNVRIKLGNRAIAGTDSAGAGAVCAVDWQFWLVTEGFGVLKRQVMVKQIDKKYDHPLAEIVQIASQYKSEILLEYDKYRINAKSIMGIIAFNPSEGMNVTIAADGKDEGEAIEALEKFFICQ